MKRRSAFIGKGPFPLSQDWERDRVRVGGAELQVSSFEVATLTPPLSREPGEGVFGSRPNRGLIGPERAETAEV